jgi:hypothetical protein
MPFDKFGDWMGAFVTSEILGEHYADEATLTILANLAKSARLPARAAVPHGLETLVRGLASTNFKSCRKRFRRGAAGSTHITEKARPVRVD